VQFRTVTYRYRGLDQIRGIREDGFLQLTEDEARLTNRKRLFDVYDRDQLQQIYEDTRKGERDIKAQGERARIARELNPLLMDEVKSTEQLDQFLLEVEKGKLLRVEEIRAFRLTLEEKKDDADLARAFLLKRVDLEREFQYEEMRLLGRGDLELRVARQRKEIRLAEVEIELKEDEEVRSHAREQAMRDHQAGLEREMATAATDLRKRQIAAEIQKIGMEMYRLHKETTLALGVKKQLELNVAKLRVRDERMRQDLAAKRETVKIEEDAKDRRAERRLRMIREMAGASVEALIAVSPDKQAQMLADLKRLDMAKGLTEEQLLALAAEKNPSLVTAFEKKFEGMSRGDLERLYERWMQDKDQARTEQTETMERMFNKALETQRDVGVAAAGASRQTIVTGSGGGPGPWPAGGPTIIGGPTVVSPGVGGATGMFRCTYCGAELRTGDRFCGGCGKAVAGDRSDSAPPSA
jgi:hypothetical protein